MASQRPASLRVLITEPLLLNGLSPADGFVADSDSASDGTSDASTADFAASAPRPASMTPVLQPPSSAARSRTKLSQSLSRSATRRRVETAASIAGDALTSTPGTVTADESCDDDDADDAGGAAVGLSSPSPGRRAATGVWSSTPRVDRSGSVNLAHSALRFTQREAALPHRLRVVASLVDHSERSTRWNAFVMMSGDTVRTLTSRARVTWNVGALVVYTVDRGGIVTEVSPAALVCANTHYYCQDVASAAPVHIDSTDAPPTATLQPTYHVAVDPTGAMTFAYVPLMAATTDAARTAIATSTEHAAYLATLDVVSLVPVGRRKHALFPLQQTVCGSGVAYLLCPCAVLHPALHVGDFVVWHRPSGCADGERAIRCFVRRVYSVNSLAAVALVEAGTDVEHVDVSPVDLERLW